MQAFLLFEHYALSFVPYHLMTKNLLRTLLRLINHYCNRILIIANNQLKFSGHNSMRKSLLLVSVVWMSSIACMAQKKNGAYRLHIQKATSPIKIDGAADEQAWNESEVSSDFF